MSKKSKEIKLSTLIYSLLILLVGYLVVVAIMLYGFGTDNGFIKKTLKILPYPAAFVNSTNVIFISDLEKELAAVKNFYESQDFSETGYRVDFSTEEGEKRLMIKKRKLLNKLIENKIIEIVSKQKGIAIDAEIVSQEVEKNLEQYGNKEEILEKIKKLYGWSLEDFKEKIAKPDMYKKNLSKYIQEGDVETMTSKKKAEEALTELKNGKSFEDVASTYSESESAKKGGSLGWLSPDQMIPEIAVSASLMQKGKISEVLESPLGFHILKLEDKKVENGVEMFKISQILVRTKNLSDWLMEQEKNIKIYVPLFDFYWDNEKQIVRFKNKELEDFEKNLDANSEGDASMMF